MYLFLILFYVSRKGNVIFVGGVCDNRKAGQAFRNDATSPMAKVMDKGNMDECITYFSILDMWSNCILENKF